MTGDPADYTAKSPERPRTPSGDVSLDPGAKVGRYEVVRFLSEGGMGAVYLARDPAVPRSVALKIIPRGADDKPDVRARFQREVRAAAQRSRVSIANGLVLRWPQPGADWPRAAVRRSRWTSRPLRPTAGVWPA